MINLERLLPSAKFSIEVDEYVPLTIEFMGRDSSDLLYWRCGNGLNSLLEIGISRKIGDIRSITLTSIDVKDVSFCTVKEEHEKLSEVEGHPIVDLSCWSPSLLEFSSIFLDNMSLPIYLEIGGESVSLFLGSSAKPESFVRNGAIQFGFLNKQLRCIKVLNLSEQQLRILSQYGQLTE